MERVAIYHRASRRERLQSGLDSCAQFCRDKGYEVVGQFTDTHDRNERRGLDELLKHSSEFDTVVVNSEHVLWHDLDTKWQIEAVARCKVLYVIEPDPRFKKRVEEIFTGYAEEVAAEKRKAAMTAATVVRKPTGKFSDDAKRATRVRIWNAAPAPSTHDWSLMMPSSSAEEPLVACAAGFEAKRMILVEERPAKMAACTKAIAAAGFDVPTRLVGRLSDVSRAVAARDNETFVGFAHLDFCGTAKGMAPEITAFCASGLLRHKASMVVTVLSGRDVVSSAKPSLKQIDDAGHSEAGGGGGDAGGFYDQLQAGDAQRLQVIGSAMSVTGIEWTLEGTGKYWNRRSKQPLVWFAFGCWLNGVSGSRWDLRADHLRPRDGVGRHSRDCMCPKHKDLTADQRAVLWKVDTHPGHHVPYAVRQATREANRGT